MVRLPNYMREINLLSVQSLPFVFGQGSQKYFYKGGCINKKIKRKSLS